MPGFTAKPVVKVHYIFVQYSQQTLFRSSTEWQWNDLIDYLKDAGDTAFVLVCIQYSSKLMNNKIFPWINESLCITLAAGCVLGSEVRLQGLMTGLLWPRSHCKHVWRLLVSIWPGSRGSTLSCYLCALTERSKTARRPDSLRHSWKDAASFQRTRRDEKIKSDPELACLIY